MLRSKELRMAGHAFVLVQPTCSFTKQFYEFVMYYVYILKSKNNPEHIYVGFTEDLNERVGRHNSGKCLYTSKYVPWELIYYSVFYNKELALNFEKYLKPHSGKAFMQKRLIL